MSNKSKMSQFDSSQGDPIIIAMFDELVEIKGWDPASIWPDYKFSSDLEMSQEDFNKLINRLSHMFLCGSKVEFSNWKSVSLRDVVDRIRVASTNSVAA